MYQLKRSLKLKQGLLLIAFTMLLSSCDGDEFQKVNAHQFVGTWELEGRTMLDGIQIEITRNKQKKFTGRIVKLNENKYVKMFSEPGDIWLTGIRRTSNYEFILTEKKLGSTLFSLYDLETTKDFKVQFIDKDTIGLSAGGADPSTSSIRYVRVSVDH